MLIMKKATIITWKQDPDQTNVAELNRARIDKMVEMIAAGKSEGFVEEIAPNTFRRYFLDEAAAQEYIDSMQALATIYGKEIVSAYIEDASVEPFERPADFVESVKAEVDAIRAGQTHLIREVPSSTN
jgi:hypothetical protein